MKKFNSHGDEQSKLGGQMYNKEGEGKGKALCENEHCGKRRSGFTTAKVQTRAEEGERIWTKDFEDRAASKDEKKKTTEKVPGCSNGRGGLVWEKRTLWIG